MNNESDKCAWIDKGDILQDVVAIGSFTSTLGFSYKTNAVHVDLGQGIPYCDCGDLNVGAAPVELKLNMLPRKCSRPACNH